MDNGFDDDFGGPATPGLEHHDIIFVNPIVLVLFALIVLLLSAIGWLVYLRGREAERQRLLAKKRSSTEAIYNSIKYYLDKALQAPGASILERARELGDMIESRLGLVLLLNAKPGKMIQALDKAVKSEEGSTPEAPAPTKVKVSRATDEHYLEVWKAVHAFGDFWSNKDEVMLLIRRAQDELTEMPVRPLRPKAANPFAAILGPPLPIIPPPAPSSPVAPPPTATAMDETSPPPEPLPPPPPSGSAKKLPAHKRNMLA